MIIHETNLRKQAFDKLFDVEEKYSKQNNLIPNYSLAFIGVITIIINNFI